jgi:hypothetical protein
METTKRPKTVMDFWCEFNKVQGGTIHQAKYEFTHKFTMKEKDRFCGILVDNLDQIRDAHHVQDFMRLRLGACGLNTLVIR